MFFTNPIYLRYMKCMYNVLLYYCAVDVGGAVNIYLLPFLNLFGFCQSLFGTNA